MRDKIRKLEAEARRLEPGPQQRGSARDRVVDYTENFIDQIERTKAFHKDEGKGAELLSSPISDEPIELGKAMALFRDEVDHPGLNPASGGHLGYIPGGGIYYSALGDYLADITNKYAGIYFAAPGAVRMENMLIRWMGEMIGYSGNFHGNITSGGSIANLIGIVTARDDKKLKGKDLERSVIYASGQMHHCVNKSIRIAGLNECPLRYIPLDENYRLKPDELAKAVAKDKADGLNPWLVIASAGTTDVGAIDPLDEIARVCEAENLWLHVDGAYGAFFMLLEEEKQKFKGIEKADSVVMDPHKGLFLPYGTGVVLVKEQHKLLQSHHYKANYMQDTFAAKEELSPADLSPELTKHFRGLRLWLPLKLLGLKPFRACLEEKLWLARYFWREIQKIKGMEVGPEPELSVVTFRYIPGNGKADEFNEKLVRKLHEDGRVFLSSTTLDGKFTIRLAVLSFRTHLSTIDLSIKIIKEIINELTAR